MHNRIEDTESKLNKCFIESNRGSEFTTPDEIQEATNNFTFTLNKILTDLYGNDANKIQQFVQELAPNSDIKVLANDDMSFKGLEGDLFNLRNFSEKFLSNLKEHYESKLSGKNLDSWCAETSGAYAKAFGNKNSVELAEAFVSSQEEGVQYVKREPKWPECFVWLVVK